MKSDKQLSSIKRSYTIKLTFAAVFLLILAQGFNALLITLSLEKLYVDSLTSSYQVLGKDLQRNLEKALRYGKNIEKFIGINELLVDTYSYMFRQLPGLEKKPDERTTAAFDIYRYVSIAKPEGTILYSTNASMLGQKLPKKARIDFEIDSSDNSKPSHFVKLKNSHLIELPLYDDKKSWVATIVISFGGDQVRELLEKAIHQNVRAGVLILAFGTAILMIVLHVLFAKFESDNRFQRRKISTAVFVVICLCQIIFSVFTTNAFRNYYLTINKQKSVTLNLLLKDDIEYYLSKGLEISKLKKLEIKLNEILAASPEISNICIFDEYLSPLYFTDITGGTNYTKPDFEERVRNAKLGDQSENPYHISINIKHDGNLKGFVSANLSRNKIISELRKIILDSVTVVIISFLFTAELLIMLFLILESQTKNLSEKPYKLHYGMIRPAAFLLLLGIDASVSFVPLHTEQLYTPVWGLSKDVVLGMPISMEMLFAGIAIMYTGIWLDRRGWQEPLVCGLFLAGFGNIYSWQATSVIHFIFSRGIVGFGYGLFWMASQGFVLANTSDQNKVRGLTLLFAGIYAGNICGSSAGALLAERVGYPKVFLIGSILVFIAGIYCLTFIKRVKRKPMHTVVKYTNGFNFKTTLKFITNPNVLSLIILSSIPSSLAVIGFLHYFSPIYLNRIGATQSSIGRIFMLYGICLVLIAPRISKFIDATANKKKFIVIGGLAGSLGLIIFQVFSGYAAAVATVILLGLSGSFDPSRNAYALKLKATHQLGVGKAMGILSMGGRLGQVIGPLAFGWCTLALGTRTAVTYLGVFYLVATALFLIIARSDRHKNIKEKIEKVNA